LRDENGSGRRPPRRDKNCSQELPAEKMRGRIAVEDVKLAGKKDLLITK